MEEMAGNKMSMHRGMTIEKALQMYTKRVEEMKLMKTLTVRWIVLYQDGKVSRDRERREYEGVTYNIPTYPWHYNKQSRLLFCYDNGHINIMSPLELFKDKLRYNGLKSNGYNQNDCKLMRAFVCDKDDFIVICSRDSKGQSHIKAQTLASRKPHGKMDAVGNVFVKDGTPYRWMVVPKEFKSLIAPILLRGSQIGILLDEYRQYAELQKLIQLVFAMSPPAIVCVLSQ